MEPTDTTSPEAPFRSGFVAFLGAPNVGKSTLLNTLLGCKIAIVNAKAQTTRDRILGIYTDDACQVAFVDAPGVMQPADRFNEYLRNSALSALEGADAAYHMVDAGRPEPLPEAAREALTKFAGKVFLVVNKADLLPGWSPDQSAEEMLGALEVDIAAGDYDAVLFVSALHAQGVDALIERTREALPEGPPLYDPDALTDRNLRFLAAEVVREKVLEHLEQEVPYSVAARCEEFVEREGAKHFVRVVVYVEQESQKGIVIGAGGAMLRRIGAAARPEIEELCDHPVYLELWVKVRKNWRKREASLREFGYAPPREKKDRRR